MRKVLPIIAAISAAGLCAPVHAADYIWLDDDHSPLKSGDYSKSLVFNGTNGVSVRASAWTIKNGTIYQAQLGLWDEGLGVKSPWSDNSHTVDNSGSLDFILFQFNQVVELDMARLNTGWHNMNDTDATIGYLDSAATTPAIPNVIDLATWSSAPSLHNLSKSTLDIMHLYGSGSAGNSGDSYRDINPDPNGYEGNVWLIGASFDNHNPDGSKKKLDGFKIEKLTFNKIPPPPPPPGGVPEPSTWATMLLGFFGLGGALRARRKKLGTDGGLGKLAGA